MPKITDKEKFNLAIKATVSYEFGQACDFVADLKLAPEVVIQIQKRIRRAGNNIERVLRNHLDHYNVTHKKNQATNVDSIADRFVKEKEGLQ